MKISLLESTLARRTIPAVILLAAIALLAYANTFNAPFVFDDLPSITENPLIRIVQLTPDSLTGILKKRLGSRPLAYITFAINYYFGQYDARGYHVVNLIIHIITALLVFFVTRETLRLCSSENTLIPFFAAALWLVNPVHTQSVTYIVQRMNSMATMFYMLALFFYIRARSNAAAGRGRRQRRLLYILCLLTAVLGLASKEIVASLPVILLLYEWFFFQNPGRSGLKKQLLRAGLAAVVIIALAILCIEKTPLGKLLLDLYETQGFSMGQRLLTEAGVVVYYICLLVFPHPARLTLVYEFPLSRALTDPVSTGLAMAALLALLFAAAYSARKHRLLSFAVCWFFVTLVIESSIIGLELIYEHRTYLPSIFPLAGIVWLAFSHIRPKALTLFVMCFAIGLCGFWTYQRNSTWQNGITLWQDTIAKSPGEAIPCINLGIVYKDLGEIDKAMACYTRACRQSTQRKDIHVIALSNIGELLLLLDRPREAADFFKSAVTAYPGYENAHINLGVALMRMGRTDDAIESTNRALANNPYLEKAYNNLGNAWFVKGDLPRAVNAFNRALAVNPYYPEAIGNLRKIEHIINKYGRLVDQLKTAVQQQPEDPQAAWQLGQISQAAGMTDQAVFWHEQALALDPGRPLYLNALGNGYAAAGRLADAAEAFEQLARQIPDKPTVFYNLACLYARQNETDKAVDRLKQAVKNGYTNWSHLQTDKDLKNIRDTDYYKSLIHEYIKQP